MVNKVEHPCIEGEALWFLTDYPHLIKNLRSAICKHNIYLTQDIVQANNLSSNKVSIDHLKKLVAFQENLKIKPAHRLSADDIDPKHFQKVDVRNALRVFNHDVVASLRYMVERGYDEELITTAWFIRVMRD